MRKRDIEKRIKQEGKKLCPSSFFHTYTAIAKTDKYLENSIHQEGEKFVPNEYVNLKAIVNPEQPKVHFFAHKKQLATFSTVIGAALIVGIITISLVPTSTQVAEAFISLSVYDSETNDDTLSFAYWTDNKGKTVTTLAENDNSKMVLAALTSDNDIETNTAVSFTENVLDYSYDAFLSSSATYDVELTVTCSKESYLQKLTDNITSSIAQYGENNNLTFVINSDTYQTSFSTTETEIVQRAKHLFFKDNRLMEGYTPKDINSYIDIYDYLPENSEELEVILEKLKVFDNYQTEDNYDKIRHALEAVYELYSFRKNTILDRLNKIDQKLNIKDSDYSSNLLSPYWWDNDYYLEEYDSNQILNFFKDFYLDEYGRSNNSTEYKHEKNSLLELLEMNQLWFSFSFDIVTDSQMPWCGDNKEAFDDVPWHNNGENGYQNTPPQGFDSWNDYWLDQYQNHHNH